MFLRGLVVSALVLLTGCSDPSPIKISEHSFLNACDDRIKGALRSPSSYQRIDHDFEMTEIREVDYRSYKAAVLNVPYIAELNKITLSLIERDGPPFKLLARVGYDAQNGFGAVIRAHAECKAMVLRSRTQISGFDIILDGESMLQQAQIDVSN